MTRPVRLAADSLLASATRHPHKEAIVTATERVDYDTLLQRSRALAARLRDCGLAPGDRVAILLENSVSSAVAVYGTWLAGGVVMVVNPQTKADKLAYLLDDSGAHALVTGTAFDRTVARACEQLGHAPTVLRPDDPTGVAPVGDNGTHNAGNGTHNGSNGTYDAATVTMPPAPAVATDLAALVYTSGSTGEPKGVMVTHQNVTFTVGSLVEYLRLGHDDRIMCVLPLAFDYGLYQLLMAVHLGATLVLEQSFAYPAQIERRIVDEQVTVFPGVPTVFATMANRNGDAPLVFPGVTRVTNTAAALATGLIDRLEQIFPNALVYCMYGLTECKRVCYLEPELVHERPGSVGKAIPGTEVFLLDADDLPVAPGGVGVLHVRGPHVMVGYWRKPEQTAHMLRPGRHAADRVLCTHDRFRMDEDGFLYFEGRGDDIIKSRGEKVSPVEVENVLYSLPGVKEAAVVGVPDDVLGQAIRAYVAPAEGVTLDERTIRRACQERLENFMVPRDVVILPELPKTDTGKVRKAGLQELIGTGMEGR
jgi:acyl-CoA synthetase (AMP-forming)/AMP-acid ligase II